MSACYLKRLKWFCFLIPALLLTVGCKDSISVSDSSPGNAPDNTAGFVHPAAPEAKSSSYKFEPAKLVLAAGEKISVEEPGYACPTLYDMDKDGAEDLIVGQFKQGKMKWYRNLSSPGEAPEYAAGKWITAGDDPAEVPGVS